MWAARHVALGTEHRLRVLQPQWADDQTRRARFLELGRVQTGFHHKGLVRITDAIDGPQPTLVSDAVSGHPLRDRLAAEGWIAPKEAVRIAIQLLEALEAATFAHGRIDADCVIQAPEGVVLLTGFGEDLAGVDPPASVVGELVCTGSAPELIDGASADGRSDVFGVGALLYEMLAGKPPFAGANAFAAMQAAKGTKPPSPDRHGEVPDWLEAVIGRALEKDRAKRFPSVVAFREALEAGPRAVALLERPSETGSSGPSPVAGLVWIVGLLGGAALLGVALVALIAVFAWLNRPAKVHSLTVTSDQCGLLDITADVYAHEPVEVLIDGNLTHTETVDGRTTFTHHTQAKPGDTVTVSVVAGNDDELMTHVVQGEPLDMEIDTMGARRAGMVGLSRVTVSGSCQPDSLRYQARLDGAAAGTGPATGSFDVDTTELDQGRHQLTVDLLDGDQVVHTETVTILVGEAPPADDLDVDGYKAGVDCDDTNPLVNPGQPEVSEPNGIDDNCDGRIDEGTVAYDDDGDGLSEQQGDCDDNDTSIRPGKTETADCRDENCDGVVDEGVTLKQVDDAYEPNDTKQLAHDLGTGAKRRFIEDLDLVASATTDDAWFAFYSQDGDFDEWGIDVRVSRMPANSAFELEVLDARGQVRGSKVVADSVDELWIRGRAFRDDSGMYWLHVQPKSLHADYCPLTVHIESR